MRRIALCASLAVALCLLGGNRADAFLCYQNNEQCPTYPAGGLVRSNYTGTSAGASGFYGVASASSGDTYGVKGESMSTAGRGLYGYASASSGTTYGVFGQSNSASGAGVYGYGANYGIIGNAGSTTGHGVRGYGGTGVFGQSSTTTGYGVYGFAPAGTGTTYGLYGLSYSTAGRGVHGLASASSGATYGVFGQSNSTAGRGIFGLAAATTNVNHGVQGQSNSTAGRGVFGLAAATTGANYGVFGQTRSPNGYGVYSQGRLHVVGRFTATGTKSAVVKIASGEGVNLYAEESSENWFSDYGSGKLEEGKSIVEIDPTFLDTINTTKEYRIFLTPEGDCEGLYIARKDEKSFEVRELRGGKSAISFSYRIVAKRKGYEDERLVKVPSEEIVALFAPEEASSVAGGEESSHEKLASTE